MTSRVLPLMALLLVGCSTPGDGGPQTDAGPDRFADYGEPIAADEDEWTWVPFEDSACGNGASVGIGISPSADSSRVLLYLEGGGLCWDDASCNQQQTAYFVGRGYNAADFAAFVDQLGDRGVFNRADPNNPFRDFSFVYVPYCTGDLHGGSRAETDYGVSHVGYQNVGAYLHRVVPTFKDATEVVLTGTSAGGYGALLNYDRVQRAFLDVPVHLLIDSAPPFSEALLPAEMQATQRAAWDTDAAIPEGCESCDDLYATFQYLLQAHPSLRVGLISSLQDQTLRYLIGYGAGTSITGSQYQAALVELLNEAFDEPTRTRVYFIPGGEHVFLYSALGSVVVNGQSLGDWTAGFLGDHDGWNHVLP